MGTADSAGADSYVCMAGLDHKEPELEIIIKEMKLIQLSPSLFTCPSIAPKYTVQGPEESDFSKSVTNMTVTVGIHQVELIAM